MLVVESSNLQRFNACSSALNYVRTKNFIYSESPEAALSNDI